MEDVNLECMNVDILLEPLVWRQVRLLRLLALTERNCFEKILVENGV
jgi:hypothetical protein